MEGLLVLLLIYFVAVPIVILVQNSQISGTIKELRNNLEARLTYQETMLAKALAEFQNGGGKIPEAPAAETAADSPPPVQTGPEPVTSQARDWLWAAPSPQTTMAQVLAEYQKSSEKTPEAPAPELVTELLTEPPQPLQTSPEPEPEAISAPLAEQEPEIPAASEAEERPQLPPAPAVPQEPTWLDRLWQSARDYLMRDGHFWVVAGVFVLFLGASFFVRHSIAMGWFPPALRLASTFAVGLALTGAGLRLRNKKAAWALVVQGCGLALMYLTVVAASERGYDLVGQIPALLVMSVLVVVTALLALWQNSQIVAHLSIVAAFVAPLLISRSSGNYVGLFSFYTVLNVGILAMCLARPWRRLYLTGFSLTFAIFGLWAAQSYRPVMFGSSVPFLVIFYLFYAFIGLHTAQESPADAPRRFRTDLTLTIMAPILFLSTMAAMAYKPYTLAIAAAFSGLMYLAVFFLRGPKLPQLTRQIIRWQGITILNLALALFLFDLNPQTLSRWTILSLTWSLEGAMLHYAGRHAGPRESIYFGLGCLGLAALFTCGTFQGDGNRVASQFLMAGLILGGAFLHAAWAALDDDRRLSPAKAPIALAWLALLAWGLFPAIEAIRLWLNIEDNPYVLNWLTTVWSLLAAALWLLTRQVPKLLRITLGSQAPALPLLVAARMAIFIVFLFQLRGLVGTYFGIFGAVLWGYDLLFQGLALALFFAIQALSIGQIRACRLPRLWLNLWGAVLVLSLGWFLFSLALQLRLPAPLPGLARLAVALAALALSIFPPRLWVEKFPENVLKPCTLILSAIALWHFAALVTDPAGASWLPYVTLLNLTDIFQAAAAILPLAALYKLAQNHRPQFCHGILYGLGILLFIWLNLVLGRAVHHYADVPYNGVALFRSGYFQSLAALVWGTLGIAAMINGHRAARRTQWLLGAALLVADLAKIFFIDLSQVGTVARIVSFLAVGTVLILVGYFAPLPPAAKKIEG